MQGIEEVGKVRPFLHVPKFKRAKPKGKQFTIAELLFSFLVAFCRDFGFFRGRNGFRFLEVFSDFPAHRFMDEIEIGETHVGFEERIDHEGLPALIADASDGEDGFPSELNQDANRQDPKNRGLVFLILGFEIGDDEMKVTDHQKDGHHPMVTSRPSRDGNRASIRSSILGD